VQLRGHHYHNLDRRNQGAQYVRDTLIKELHSGVVGLPALDGDDLENVGLRELGVSYPVLVNPLKVEEVELADPNAIPDAMPRGEAMGLGGLGGRTRGPADPSPGAIRLKRFDFTVHFCWQPKTPSERRAAKKAEKQPAATEQP